MGSVVKSGLLILIFMLPCLLLARWHPNHLEFEKIRELIVPYVNIDVDLILFYF
ncbi:hypothetical protein [Vibrio vulnificus YJ016]|uniref:Uncharacterized protein n=1 Tax=Vibrio vulnificus (strain YJ016) TaxID=196600 RepID=Q7MJB7_VIBVY|nr:hypothetical protein [Vibrio vulnificus YJ016]